MSLGNMWQDPERLAAAADALKSAAFNIETVMHLGGMERELNKHATELRQLARSMDRRIAEITGGSNLEELETVEDRMKVAAQTSFDGLFYDICLPKFDLIQIQWSQLTDGKTIWVNIGPVCVLRISGYKGALQIERNGPEGFGGTLRG